MSFLSFCSNLTFLTFHDADFGPSKILPFIKDDELLNQTESEPTLYDCVRFPDDFLLERRGLEKYLTAQLSVSRLNAIHRWLWRAGLPGGVQPLHHQQVLQRAIVVTERVELHLVWYVHALLNRCWMIGRIL